MILRLSVEEDIDQILELWLELLRVHEGQLPSFRVTPGKEQEIKKELQGRLSKDDTRAYVAENDGILVGMIFANYSEYSPAMVLHHRGYIAETVVRDEFRGQGIGKQLYLMAEKWLIEKGADHIELQVSDQNPGALQFWDMMGFSNTTRHMIKIVTKEMEA